MGTSISNSIIWSMSNGSTPPPAAMRIVSQTNYST